jgi:hypothetical protein
MLTVKQAVARILSIANIQTKTQLDEWCGGSKRKRLYDEVALLAPEDWSKFESVSHRRATAEARWAYEVRLEGYALHN